MFSQPPLIAAAGCGALSNVVSPDFLCVPLIERRVSSDQLYAPRSPFESPLHPRLPPLSDGPGFATSTTLLHWSSIDIQTVALQRYPFYRLNVQPPRTAHHTVLH